MNLDEKSLALAAFAAILQYIQMKMMMKGPVGQSENDDVRRPSHYYCCSLESSCAIGLYWAVSNLFSIGQQWFINKKTQG